MKLTIPQADLRRSLDRVVAAIKKPAPTPILESVLVEARAGRLRLLGGTADYTLAVEDACRVEGEGQLALPAQPLRDLVRAFPEQPLTLGALGTIGFIESGRSRADLPGLPADEYPTSPSIAYGSAAVAADLFATLIDRTTFAAMSDESDAGLHGVQIRVRGGQIAAYATDKFRLVRAVAPLAAPAEEEFRALLLPRVLDLVRRLAGEGEVVALGRDDEGRRVGFRTPAGELVASTLDLKYPDCERVFEAAQVHTVIHVDRAALLQELARLNVLANPQTHRVELAITEQMVTFRAGQEGASVRGQLPVQVRQGGAFSAAVNGRYFADILQRFPGDVVEVGFSSPERPLLVRPLTGLRPGEAASAILMPLRHVE